MATKKIPYARAVLSLADGDQVSIPVWEQQHCLPSVDATLARVASAYASQDEPFAPRNGQLIRQRDNLVLGIWSADAVA
jgi:hypothetical protein